MNDMNILGRCVHRTMIESCCKIANLEFEQGTDFDTLCLLYIESKINFNVDFYPSIFNESMTKSIIKKPSMTNDNLINDFMTLTNENTKLTENIDTNEFDLITINDFMTLTKDDKKLTENIDTKKIDLIPINIPEKITIYDNMTFEQQQQSETANILNELRSVFSNTQVIKNEFENSFTNSKISLETCQNCRFKIRNDIRIFFFFLRKMMQNIRKI